MSLKVLRQLSFACFPSQASQGGPQRGGGALACGQDLPLVLAHTKQALLLVRILLCSNSSLPPSPHNTATSPSSSPPQDVGPRQGHDPAGAVRCLQSRRRWGDDKQQRQSPGFDHHFLDGRPARAHPPPGTIWIGERVCVYAFEGVVGGWVGGGERKGQGGEEGGWGLGLTNVAR